VPAPDTFSTDRLVARRIDRADQPFLEAMWRDPAVNATLGGPRDAAGVEQMLDRMLDNWARRGFGVWILRDRRTNTPVGWVGLHETDTGGPGGVELLYAIASARWREGLAREAGHEAVEIARGLGLDELVCFTLVDNIASRRTMEGLGFTNAQPIEHAGLPHVLTRLVLRQREVSERG
jgi:[ribosomal protein S5]-alanine N-acetyltransferase